MSRQLAIEGSEPSGLRRSPSLAEAEQVASRYVLEPGALNTRRAYRNAFKRWCDHCDAQGMPWAPIAPGELVTYLQLMTLQGAAPNTVRLHLTALCELDKASRITPADPDPPSLRAHPGVRRWEDGWQRDNPRAPRRRAPSLTASDLERLLMVAAEPVKHGARAAHVVRYARDRCLILFGVCGALRGAELAALELADVQFGERGLQVRVRRSKTDQHGESALVGLMPQGRALLCPVDAFQVWRAARGLESGPLFGAVSRSAVLELEPLSERQITRMVKERAARAGIALASAHSLRATFATLASSKGKNLARIMQHGRWLSPEVAATYVRQGELFRDNASGGLLDD